MRVTCITIRIILHTTHNILHIAHHILHVLRNIFHIVRSSAMTPWNHSYVLHFIHSYSSATTIHTLDVVLRLSLGWLWNDQE